MSEAGVKFDSGKARWTLLPWRELEEVVRVLMYGAAKYPSDDNWKRVDLAPVRYRDALVRHVLAYLQGERLDAETGRHHLASAVCNCLFLMWFDNEDRS